MDELGQQVVVRILDFGLANLLQLTQKRWHYLKGVLLREKALTPRTKKLQLLESTAREVTDPGIL